MRRRAGGTHGAQDTVKSRHPMSMDLGWVVTLAGPDRPQVQLTLVTHDATAPVVPVASVQVDDVDAAFEAARAVGAEIVHELTTEPWGVRRFFVRDPDGHVINILGHD